MNTVTIYHNPSCGTSRNTLALLRENGHEPLIIEYLKTPLDKAQIKALLGQLKLPAHGLLREKEKIFAELGLHDAPKSEDALIAAMVEYPILMQRPVVVTAKGAKICRPSELVLELL